MIPICSVHIILKKIILQDVWEKFSGVNQDCWLKLNEKKANWLNNWIWRNKSNIGGSNGLDVNDSGQLFRLGMFIVQGVLLACMDKSMHGDILLHLVCVMAGVTYNSMAPKNLLACCSGRRYQRQQQTWRDGREEVEGKDMEGFSPRRYRERHESERWSGLSRRVVAAPWVLASGDEGTTKTGKAGSARRGSRHGGAGLVQRPTGTANRRWAPVGSRLRRAPVEPLAATAPRACEGSTL